MFIDDLPEIISDAIPTFTQLEPGEGQRWSTWPAITPTQRGPLPHPEWVVTDSAAFDTELGVVKSGKEADLFLIERAVPDVPSRAVILAAKRYRGAEVSDFHRSSDYRAGRKLKNSRDTRAVMRKSDFGRQVSASGWAFSEFEFLCALYDRGLPVPYPVQVNGTEILMEFIGDGAVAAPRLAQSRAHGEELRDAYEQVVDILSGFVAAGLTHGDFSPYNLLVQGDRVVVIDLPQVIDIVSNPVGLDFLHRDCVNVCDWFVRRGLDCDAEALFGELVAGLY